MNMIDKNFREALGQILGGVFAKKSSARRTLYMYFSNTGNYDKYFFTTVKVNFKGKQKYVSGICRYIETEKTWKLINEAEHELKENAYAKALELFKNKI